MQMLRSISRGQAPRTLAVLYRRFHGPHNGRRDGVLRHDVGDIPYCEKGAQIGFAGARVIESTIRAFRPPVSSVRNIS